MWLSPPKAAALDNVQSAFYSGSNFASSSLAADRSKRAANRAPGNEKNTSMSLPKSITIVEVGPREGFQFEDIGQPQKIATADKIRLIEMLADTGVKTIQMSSFVSPKQVRRWPTPRRFARRSTATGGPLHRHLP